MQPVFCLYSMIEEITTNRLFGRRSEWKTLLNDITYFLISECFNIPRTRGSKKYLEEHATKKITLHNTENICGSAIYLHLSETIGRKFHCNREIKSTLSEPKTHVQPSALSHTKNKNLRTSLFILPLVWHSL